MKNIKKYSLVLALSTVVLILMVVRLTDSSRFKPDSEKNSEPSVSANNVVEYAKLMQELSDYSFIYLGQISEPALGSVNPYLIIEPSDILSANTLKSIKRLKGKRVLISDNLTLSSRCWMLLAQKGVNDIYILSNYTSPELFKYKFRPRADIATENRN